MTVIEDNGNRASMDGKQTTLTKSDVLETMPSWPPPVLTQKSLVGELSTTIRNVVHHVLALGLEVLSDALECENSANIELQQVDEERDCLLEERNAHKIEQEKLEKMLLWKEIVTKAITQSVLVLERTLNHLETDKILLPVAE